MSPAEANRTADASPDQIGDPVSDDTATANERADAPPPSVTKPKLRWGWLPGFTHLGIRSLALRLVAGSALLILVGLGAGYFTLLAVYQDAVRRAFDLQLTDDFAEILSGVESIEGQSGKFRFTGKSPSKFREEFSGAYWQVTYNGATVLTSRNLRSEPGSAPDRRERASRIDVQKPTKLDSYVSFEIEDPFVDDRPLRVLARSFRLSDGRRGVMTIYIARDFSGSVESIDEFANIMLIALGLLGLFLVLAVFVQIRFGLAPLRRVPPALAAIRTGKADRLTGVFPTEVQPLATEINELLDHNARVVERARTHVGNLAHALKTPLAVLTNEAGTRDSEMSRIVDQQTGIMREQVEHHLSRARMAARAAVVGASTSVMPVLEGLERTLTKIYKERGIRITVEGPPDIGFRGERQDLEELMGNLMDNACKWAHSRVKAAAAEVETDKGPRLFVTVEDDGPGLTPSERVQAVKRGQRMDEKTPGSGLGLSIVSDIADSYGGSFTLFESSLGGLLARLDLPLAAQ